MRNMEDEECAHHEAHFIEELESLKTDVARLTSFLEQTCWNASSEAFVGRLIEKEFLPELENGACSCYVQK